MLRKACRGDLDQLTALVKQHRVVFPFLPRAVFEDSIEKQEVIVSEDASRILGFVRYHHRKDGITTLHEITVCRSHVLRGVGRSLIQALEKECVSLGQKAIRLKCPLDLPANGFYSHLGFRRISVEDDLKRPLAVWEKPVACSERVPRRFPSFFITLTHEAGEIRRILRLWDESGDGRDPFARVIFTPVFSKPATIATIRQLKEERGSEVMFDSGGYQVQMGKVGYEELFGRLLGFYRKNDWADWYVLPDHVPRSTDSDREVEFKVCETLDFARLFLRMMPGDFAAKAVGVVHGRTQEQVRRCIETYTEMGVNYIGFGSFGTSGPNGTVNLVSQKNLLLLRLVQTLARERRLPLHIFGIGSPSHLIRFRRVGVIPHSFDSAGWWKAAGFGNIFFPAGRQLHITAISTAEATLSGMERQKRHSGHECPFCDKPKLLRRSRMKRILHNLAVMLDTVNQVYGGNNGEPVVIPHSAEPDRRAIMGNSGFWS